MAQEQAKQLLQQGIAATKNNRPDIAREAFLQAVRLDPQNESIWLWLSSVARDDKERLFCLKQLLAINPQNEFALKGLRALGVQPAEAPEAAAAPSAAVPVLVDDKYTRAQQVLDEFLRSHNPLPADVGEVQWTHKQGRRYGESGATRLRQGMYVAAALVFVLLAGVIILVISQVGIPGSNDGTSVANAPTRQASIIPSPTMTPTPGGNTPTPMPAELSVFASPTVASNFIAGNIYGAAPTEIHPALGSEIRRIQGAIDFYSIGAYPSALGTLEAIHEQIGNACYQNLIYYEALSQAGLGDLEAAAELLQAGLNSSVPAETNFCDGGDAALLYTGLAYISYLEGNYDDAVSYSQQARSLDRDLIPAVVIQGQAYTALGNYQEAWRVLVDQGIEGRAQDGWDHDVNLRLAAAENELYAGNPESALAYLGVAVHLEPAALKVLDLQARVYLALAEKTPDTDDMRETRLQYYGFAVQSAQTILLYYPGESAGYLYLAQARLGEGNYEQAETALTRIIELEQTLPPSAGPIIDTALKVRGNLYYYQGRLDAARSDFRRYLALTATRGLDQDIVVKLVEIALGQKDYSEAITRLDELLALDPTNVDYLLLQTRIRSEICTFAEPDLCEYTDTLQLLNDEFVATLTTDTQRAAAYSYRAQARYWETQSRVSLPEEERLTAYQTALSDINQAIQLRQMGVDHYYRGLLLQQLGMLTAAVEEFRWLDYWNEAYTYPFVQVALEDQVVSIENQIAETATVYILTLQPTATPTAEAPTATLTATSSPTASLTVTPSPTVSPTITPTPLASPTLPQIP